MPRPLYLALLVPLFLPAAACAGLYYSGETQEELSAQWRGFLLDHRALRLVASPAPTGGVAALLREQYQDAAKKLEDALRVRALSADESADLGALYVRLGKAAKAVEVLRAAQRQHPEHFRIAANLGTAWQVQGELTEAAAALQEAVRLAPPKLRSAEECHLKLVRLRQKEKKNTSTLDDLFGVTFSGQPGKQPLSERQKLPADAAAIAQQLALWLPADGRLLWQLGELANAYGDVRTAANILDGCVTELGMAAPELRQHRQAYRIAADEIAKLPDDEHAKYKGDLLTKSARALARKFDLSRLPPVRADGVNDVPWPVLAETTMGKSFKPRFVKYLEELEGKRVALSGFMQPLRPDDEVPGFLLIEYPVGCWFCETPEPAMIVFVTLPDGKTTPIKRGPVKVEGVLKLNRDDPEDFLYTIQKARVAEPD
jgi:Tfp pilus assembly protein PilF